MNRFLAFIYRNAKAYKPGASHIGLGVSAMQHVIVLRRAGVACDCYSAYEITDLLATLASIPPNSIVIIEALWLVTINIQKLLARFPAMHFVVRCHSQIGFLQVEPQAVQLLREQLLTQEMDTRFEMAGNNQRFTYFVEQAYGSPCTLLPNLYDNQRVVTKRDVMRDSRAIRVGCFGALRNLKLQIAGAAGAMLAAKWLQKDLEFNLSVGRDEGGGPVVQSITNLLANLPTVTLVKNQWTDWPTFKRLVASMDICVQVSATETFNIVTADCFAEGTPCIVGPAIDWAPQEFMAEIDDPESVGSKLYSAYTDPRASHRAITSLARYLDGAVQTWLDWINSFNAIGYRVRKGKS